MEREGGENNGWSFGGVSPDVAIKGFGGAILLSARPEKTAELLEEVMGLEKVGEEGDYIRFRSTADIGNLVDVKKTSVGRDALEWGRSTISHGGRKMTKTSSNGSALSAKAAMASLK